MPKDEYSDLRRAYAAAGGLTLRTAQRHQKQSHPDWTRFIGVQASDAVRAAEKTGAMDPVGGHGSGGGLAVPARGRSGIC